MESAKPEDSEVLASAPEDLREQALRRVRKRRDFHTHAFVYFVVNVVLWGLWTFLGLSSHDWNPWPLWVTLAWGLGLVFNAWDVYVRRPISEDEIQHEIERLEHHGRRRTARP